MTSLGADDPATAGDDYDAKRDSIGSWEQSILAIREKLVRKGTIPPTTEQERQQAAQGMVPYCDFDCAVRK